MVVGPDTSRPPREDEFDEVDALLRAAFGRPQEAELVRRLRADGLIVLEAVKSWHDRETGAGRIGAYLAISRMVAPRNWFCLAPVAVWPAWQNGALARHEGERRYYRFGSRLVQEYAQHFAQGEAWFADALRRRGVLQGDEKPTLVVLGKPSFYARAGFSKARAARLVTPYPVDYTLIARPGADVPEARLVYPAAFAAL